MGGGCHIEHSPYSLAPPGGPLLCPRCYVAGHALRQPGRGVGGENKQAVAGGWGVAQGVMAPRRAVSVCWAYTALLLWLPGCDGQNFLQGLFGSQQTSLQSDEGSPSAAVVYDAAGHLELPTAKLDAAEPQSATRRSERSTTQGVLSGIQSVLMGEARGSNSTRSKRQVRGDVKMPKCPPHPMEKLAPRRRRDIELKDWIVAGIQVSAQPFTLACPTLHRVGMWAAGRMGCERRRVRDVRLWTVLRSSQAAPVSDYPFANNIFWCNVFPPEVYAALDELWIPSQFMHQDRKSGRSKKASHKNADQRYKCSLDDFLKTSVSKGQSCVQPTHACALEATPSQTVSHALVLGLAVLIGAVWRVYPRTRTACMSSSSRAETCGSRCRRRCIRPRWSRRCGPS